MGRPSGLGSEEYHNRAFPLTEFTPGFDPGSTLLEPPHCAIIEHMVHFSRLIRQVCIDIYLPQNSAARTVDLAQHLDQRFDNWLSHLPHPIRPRLDSDQSSKLGSHKEAMWMKRQKLVLNMRKSHSPVTMRAVLQCETNVKHFHVQATSTSGSCSSGLFSSLPPQPRDPQCRGHTSVSRNAWTQQRKPSRSSTRHTTTRNSSAHGQLSTSLHVNPPTNASWRPGSTTQPTQSSQRP